MVGTRYDIEPQPPVLANTTWVEAGLLRFGVEYRSVDLAGLAAELGDDSEEMARIREVAPPDFDEEGVSVHVCDAATGHERLRFDAFRKLPHYHYIEPAGCNIVVEYDEAACGPVLPWVLSRLRDHLPEMLAAAGASALAAGVEASDLMGPVDEVERLCELSGRSRGAGR